MKGINWLCVCCFLAGMTLHDQFILIPVTPAPPPVAGQVPVPPSSGQQIPPAELVRTQPSPQPQPQNPGGKTGGQLAQSLGIGTRQFTAKEILEWGRQVAVLVDIPNTGTASGFLISPDGLVLTNKHVSAGSERAGARGIGKKLKITFWDGRQYSATTVAEDGRYDLGLLKIDNVSDLPYAVMAESIKGIRKGDLIYAVGSPQGAQFKLTVAKTLGIGGQCAPINREAKHNSCVYSPSQSEFNDGGLLADGSDPPPSRRDRDGGFIRPGNSGSPLFDQTAKVIAVNHAIDGRNNGYSVGIEDVYDFLRTSGYWK